MSNYSRTQSEAAFCAGVDWGTSSFRLWLLDRTGAVLGESRSDEGMSYCARESGFASVLARHLAGVCAPAALPVVICGMAGARQGWLEAPYIDVPALLSEIPDHAVRVPETSRDVRILPGMSQRPPQMPDVMRGEETQLLGLASELRSAIICLPGTHSKWVTIEHGSVRSFSTCITGELFSILRQHSTLTYALGTDGAVDSADPVFEKAVVEAFERPADIVRSFFALRAQALLLSTPAPHLTARLSGLLIGAELATASVGDERYENVVLAASGPLSRLYASAFTITGISFVSTDAEEASRNGLLLAAHRFWS